LGININDLFSVTKEELEHMYQKFKDLKVQDEVASIHFEQFEALLFQYFPFWREALPNVGEMMYRVRNWIE
jgi:hypothetical protein